jgi:signal transduction histidine kinase
MTYTFTQPASVNECFLHLRHFLFATYRQLKPLYGKEWEKVFPKPSSQQDQHRQNIALLLEQIFSDEFYEATQAASPRRAIHPEAQLKVCLALIATETFPKVKQMLEHSQALVKLIDDSYTDPQILCILRIERSLRTALAQLSDTALYYRVHQRLVRISPRPFAFDLLLNTQVQMAKKALAQRPIRLEFAPPPQALVLSLDPLWINFILACLFSNALRFTASGRIRVELQAADGQGMIRLTIHDTGPGLAPEALADLFRAYSRISRHEGRPQGVSYGLSLPISRELARLHGGDIHVKSQVDVGSSFTLFLPSAFNPP